MNLVISAAIRAKLASKHGVTEAEVRQCFENREGRLLQDTREDHQIDPPTQWFISYTNQQRKLKVVFVLKEGNVYLKTAYEPNLTELTIYSRYG